MDEYRVTGGAIQICHGLEAGNPAAVDVVADDNLSRFVEEFDDDIEEDLPSEKDRYLVEPLPAGIAASQSLGIDKSVDSLAIGEYDHIEYVENS